MSNYNDARRDFLRAAVANCGIAGAAGRLTLFNAQIEIEQQARYEQLAARRRGRVGEEP